MPYIERVERAKLDPYIRHLIYIISNSDKKKGETTYVIYKLLVELFGDGGYSDKVKALGVLDSTSKEYYRKVMAPYEDEKIEENGDI